MSPTMRSLPAAIALSCLLLPATARVIWIPEEFDPLFAASRLTPRQESTCGGDPSLQQCGGDFPTDFCCPSGTTCLSLQTEPSVTASICCPAGRDCNSIGTVGCDQRFQNATLVPSSQLHSDPTVALETCGEACCPMGYECRGDSCVALPEQASASSSATPTPVASSSDAPTSPTSSSESTAPPTAFGGAGGAISGDSDQSQSPSNFDGKSFAAGFVPGLVIGALLAACLIVLLLRKKRRSSGSYRDGKGYRDTLTDLSTSPSYRPTMHGRSISEPVVDPRFATRNEFLRGSPPRGEETATVDRMANNVEIHSDVQRPITPGRTPRIKALFSHSPFMVPQTPATPPTAPIPAHLKRGTLSFKISPVRALKKQKSMHSLRRQMTDASRGVSRSNSRPKLDRSDSRETILVQMTGSEPFTPDRTQPPQMSQVPQTMLGRAMFAPHHDSTSTWISHSTTTTSEDDDDTPDERAQPRPLHPPAAPPSNLPPLPNATYTTPTRAPANPSTGALGSPYTPTTHPGGQAAGGNGLLGAGLQRTARGGPVEDHRRDTTFSAMMERAGLRRSDLIPVPPVPARR